MIDKSKSLEQLKMKEFKLKDEDHFTRDQFNCDCDNEKQRTKDHLNC